MTEHEALEYAIGALTGLGLMAAERRMHTDAQLRKHDEVTAFLVDRLRTIVETQVTS